jgi:hypothetical protein
MARLGGWTRIGIIISVVWILGAGIYIYNVAVNRGLSEARQICFEWENAAPTGIPETEWDREGRPLHLTPDQAVARDRQIEECYKKQIAREPSPRKAALITSAIFTFVPLALGWGFVYLILFLVNWVKRGFMQPL